MGTSFLSWPLYSGLFALATPRQAEMPWQAKMPLSYLPAGHLPGQCWE